MRLISFMLTKDQVLAQDKTQTRRVGSERLKVGDRLRGVLKCQGRSRKCDVCDGVGTVSCDSMRFSCPGCDGTSRTVEPLVDLAIVEVTAVRRERLDLITQEDVIAEGFPGMTPAEFVEMFCEHMRAKPDREVTVIDFRYLDEEVATHAAGDGPIAAAAWLDRAKGSKAKLGSIEAVLAAVQREAARHILVAGPAVDLDGPIDARSIRDAYSEGGGEERDRG